MEQLKNVATTHAKKLQYIYLIGAGIAAINTLGRADYNFIIYLYMFYVTKYMQDSVYYHKDSDTFIIAEVENDTLFIHNIFSCSQDTVDAVTKLFGEDLKKVTLGFTPQDTETYTVREFHEDDCTFFIRGEQLQIMEEHKLRIPSLAHA